MDVVEAIELLLTDLGISDVKQRIRLKQIVYAAIQDDEDYTINEIANKLGCDPSTLRRNLSKIISNSYEKKRYEEELGSTNKPKGKEFINLVIKKTKGYRDE